MTNHHHNQITTSRRARRSARQGRAAVRTFSLAVYVTCNPVRYARDRQQRSNQARRRRLSRAEAQRIQQLHWSGQTLKQIGATLRINRDIITRELRVHGIVLTPHPSITTRRMSLLDAEVAQIRTMQKQGRTMAYIAEEICVCRDVVRRELRARGLPTSLTPRRMSLLDAEVEQIQTLLKQGRNMEYIAEEICVCRHVIMRELRAKGLPTRPERRRRRVKKSISGWWGALGDDPNTY